MKSAKMKIAVIGAKGLPAKQGGIEHHCEEIYSRVVEQGHEVDLFARSSYTGDISLSAYNVHGVRVVSIPSLNIKGMDALLSSALGAIASNAKRYDIVHFHALGPALFTWLPKFASSAKVVVTCHGLDWQRAKWNKASSDLIRRGERAAVRFSDGMIVVSEELRSYFSETYGKDTIYIPNAPSNMGDSDPTFSYGTSLGLEQGRYILFLGRLVPEKCPDLLIKAFQNLQQEGWKLVMVGGTSDTNEFTSEITEMAANNKNIIFTGELRGPRLAEILRGAGLFVLPSELEGLPLSMLEAMQEGVPVLGSDIPVHQQLIGKDRGMLFQVKNVDSCLRSLEWAINHQKELAVMAKNAQSYVQAHYTWNQITSETLEMYRTLTAPVPIKPDPKRDSKRSIPVSI